MLGERQGGRRARQIPELEAVRDRVLDGAALAKGDVVLDVGTGDGLIGFGALVRVGAAGRVIFSDVSPVLLDVCRAEVEQMGAADRCEFVEAHVEELAPVPDGSVDAATARSVLIYVEEKQRAFDELHRVLRPGGRLSIFEPVNRFSFPDPDGRFAGYDVGPVADLAAKVEAGMDHQADATLVDFDERDLFSFAERTGFEEVHLDYEAHVERRSWLDGDWDAVLRTAGNPLIPTLGEAIEQALTRDEAARFEAHLRPLVERGEARQRRAVAYLRALKRGS